MLKKLLILPLALASLPGVSAAQTNTPVASTPVRNIVLVHGALIAVGSVWFALWLVYLVFVFRYFPRVRTAMSS